MIAKILKLTDCEQAHAKNVCVFLADYGARLLASGATCIRLDKNISRIARAYGMETELTVMPRHIHLTVTESCSGEILTSIATVPESGISFEVNTQLSRLSWEIADNKMDFYSAVEKYESIIAEKKQSPWFILFLVALANASFCRLFGGDPAAMLTVGVATLAGYFLKTRLMAWKVDTRLVFIVCAFVSTVIGAADLLLSIGSTPQVAIGTSVLYLVPGIPFLNSFSDLLYRRYLCAFARFADALILTCCLSAGLCLGMALMGVSMF